MLGARGDLCASVFTTVGLSREQRPRTPLFHTHLGRGRDTNCPHACVRLSYRGKSPAAVLSRSCCISAPILVKLLAPPLMNERPLVLVLETVVGIAP